MVAFPHVAALKHIALTTSRVQQVLNQKKTLRLPSAGLSVCLAVNTARGSNCKQKLKPGAHYA